MGYKTDLLGAAFDAAVSCLNLVETLNNPKRPIEIFNEGKDYAIENEKRRLVDARYNAQYSAKLIENVLQRVINTVPWPMDSDRFFVEKNDKAGSAQLLFDNKPIARVSTQDSNYFYAVTLGDQTKRFRGYYPEISRVIDNAVTLHALENNNLNNPHEPQ